MSAMVHARRFLDRDGATVRAMQFDGRVAAFGALLAVFPGRIAPHPTRDDALLVLMDSGGRTRIEAGDWVVALPDGSFRTYPDDQFHLRHQPEAIAA